jgi:hypothetical protein
MVSSGKGKGVENEINFAHTEERATFNEKKV